jgi:dolichol-phosphate mannosyltransferase
MIIVLLPAYNEEESIRSLLTKIHATLSQEGLEHRMIVCNDGSRDRTAEILAECQTSMPLEVLTHRRNRGLGETARDLFERAVDICQPDDVIVRLDCDDTHEPQYLLALIRKLDEGYDVSIASRFLDGGGQRGVSPFRAFISSCANLFMKVIFPIRGLREYSCGFRAYRAGLIQQAIATFGNNFIQLKGLGFTCTLEKLVKLKLLGARFAEVPFVLRYDNKLSSSKMVSSVTTLGYMVMAVCYHWPWGGWRTHYRDKAKYVRPAPPVSNDTTVRREAA